MNFNSLQVPDTNVIKWVLYPHRQKTLFLSWMFSELLCTPHPPHPLTSILRPHLSRVQTWGQVFECFPVWQVMRRHNRIQTDPSVCVLLTDLSHITISMATRAVTIATASSQSVLQLDVRAVAVWVTIWGSRQVTLTFTKVSPPLLLLSSLLHFSVADTSSSFPSWGKQNSPLLPLDPQIFLFDAQVYLLFHTLHVSPPSYTLFPSVVFPFLTCFIQSEACYKQIGTLTAHHGSSQAEAVIESLVSYSPVAH